MCNVCSPNEIDDRTIISLAEFAALNPYDPADEPLVTSALKVATSKIQRYLNRKLFYFKNVEEYIPQIGLNYLQTRNFPIYHIERIEYLECVVEPSLATCDAKYIYGSKGRIGLSYGMPKTSDPSFNGISHAYVKTSMPLIKVIYSGGYALESETTGGSPCVDCTPADVDVEGDEALGIAYPEDRPVETMPEDLKMACYFEALTFFNALKGGCASAPALLRSESFADRSVTYRDSAEVISNSGLLPSTIASIKSYRVIPQR